MTSAFRIERRFRGPPASGNGGYVSGRLASYIDGPAVVRLLVPPPLETPMDVRPVDGRIELLHGDIRVATARRTKPAKDVPSPPSYREAEAAALAYRGFRWHPFPTCFVCGPGRDPGDGLRIFAGPVSGAKFVAAPWIPHASLGTRGVVSTEFVWAALDCPGAFSFESSEGTALLLGEIAATLIAPVRVGNPHIALGWEIDRKDRRHYTGTAIFTESGECLALARSTWFEVPAVP